MDEQNSQADEMKEIIAEFIVESTELIDTVIQDVVVIENNPDKEVINAIFRAVHTIKGTSSFLGFGVLSELAHRAEDVLGLIRKDELVPDRNAADALLDALDLMKLLIEDIKTQGSEKHETQEILDRLDKVKTPEKKKIGDILIEENVLTRDELQEVLKKQDQEKDKKLGEILVEEKLITEGQLENFLSKQKVHKTDQTIRIDVKKLDELMNLIGELVLGKNRLIMLNSIAKKGSDNNGLIDNLMDVTNYIEVITNDLQLSIMRARLTPISKVFNTIPRLVRDLCKEFKKEIEIKIEGEATELDRSLIEGLHDPLIHVIRNSVDHGVEMPEERVERGKPPKGTLSVKAYNEGNHVIIELYDDGKGIDLVAVKEKVREKNLISETELNNLSDHEMMNLIFIPGLSTAKKLSSVSGRGVGMDVVQTNIQKMNGQVSIDSEKGGWTRLTIKLPLTLAIMRALVVTVGDDIYALPLNAVEELVKLKEGAVKSVDKNEVLVLRDKIIPVVDLSKVFNCANGHEDDGYVVICNINNKIVGIKVQAVVGQEEVVIKPLGEFLGNVDGVGGVTIRGDGKAIPIVDVPAMVGTYIRQSLNRKVMA